MGFWNKLPSDNEADRAEMLESYTSWVRGDKLSGKQKRFLRVFQEMPDCHPLKEMVDLAHQHFQKETKDVVFFATTKCSTTSNRKGITDR